MIANPLCEVCLQKGKITPATQIHHIDSFMKYEGNERLEKAYDFDNLQSLCQECHNAEHNPIKKYSDEEDLKT